MFYGWASGAGALEEKTKDKLYFLSRLQLSCFFVFLIGGIIMFVTYFCFKSQGDGQNHHTQEPP